MLKISRFTLVKSFVVILITLLCYSKTTVAQSNFVKVSVSVLPPYSNNFNEYTDVMNRVMVTLQNNNPTGGIAQVWLKAKFSDGDNIVITSDPAKKSLTPISINFGSIRTLTMGEIKEILGVNNVLYSGISKSQVLSQGLPEGSYSLCIEAYNIRDNQLISDQEPLGCSNTFNIFNIEPPTTQQPMCTETLNPLNPQNLVFSWLPPAGAPISTKYILRMTEVMPLGRSPYDAMLASTYPYFFEQQSITGTTFLYTTAQPMLTKGRMYAYTVTAVDPQYHTLFKNNGQSEICWFKWGVSDTAKINPDTVPFQKTKLLTTVCGTLNYSYSSNDNPSFPLKNTSVVLKVVYKNESGVAQGSESFDMNTYNSGANSNSGYQVDRNGNLNFNQTEQISNSNTTVNRGGYNSYAQFSRRIVSGIGDSNIVSTNSNGEFCFHLNLDPSDTLGNYILNPQNPNEKLYKWYSLQIYNPYYETKEVEFQVSPGQTKELGVIVNKVKTYNLNVNVRQLFQWRQGKIMEGMDVYLLRKTKSNDLPQKEGDLDVNYLKFNGYIVVATATTSIKPASTQQNTLENSVTFTNLVKNIIPGDNYVIYAQKHTDNQPQVTQTNEKVETEYINILYNPQTVGNIVPALKRTLFIVYPTSPHSLVTGTLSYKYPNNNLRTPKPLANTKVSLIVQYRLIGKIGSESTSEIINATVYGNSLLPSDNNIVLQTVTTGSNGEFAFDYANIDSTKITNPDFSFNQGDVEASLNGKLERIIRLKVENPYYCSPDDDIKVQPWSNYNAGSLTSYVMSYQLKVKAVIEDAYKNALQTVNISDASGAIAGIKFTLYRSYRDPDIPTNEGTGMNVVRKINGKNMMVVSEGNNLVDGTLIFKDLVRSNYPDDNYMITATTSENSSDDKNYLPNTVTFPCKFGSERDSGAIIRHPSVVTIYNSDYTTTKPYQYYSKSNFEQIIKMTPRNPRVAGRVISTAAPNGVRNALVFIIEDYKNSKDKVLIQHTDSMGYFQFNDLNVELQDSTNYTSNIIGPSRKLNIYCDGYKSSNLDLGILIRGTQYNNPNLQLIPLGTDVFGIVRDSIPNINNPDLMGDPIAARVKIGDGAYVNTYNTSPYEDSGNHQKFKMDAAKGVQQLTIVPFDPIYAPKTFTINITQPKQWLGEFEFNKLKHKIKIKVVKMGEHAPYAVVGAKVKLLNMEIISNNLGEAYFEFTNNAITNFVAEITPSPSQSFVPKSYGFSNSESQGLQKITIELDDGAILKGKVISATTKQPLKRAKVFVEQGNGTTPFVAITDNNGDYQLNGVPRHPNKQTIRVAYSESGSTPNPQTYIGKSVSVPIPSAGNPANVNFELSTFTAFDISSLLGMPIEIDSLTDLGNSLIQINGAFVNIKSNPNFKLLDSNFRIPFAKMRVVKGSEKNAQGVTIGVPFLDSYGLDIYSIPIRIFDNFYGEVRPRVSVINFEKDYPTKKGKITGLVRIVDNSFNFPSSYMTISEKDFYLGNYGQGSSNDKTIISAFKAPSVAYPKTRFTICKYDASGFNFKLLGFNGSTTAFSPRESYIVDDTVALFLTLNTTLPFNPPIPLTIEAGKVILHHDRIDPIDNYNEINFNLETWAVKGNGWKLANNSGGILIKEGIIKTGIIDVPFTNMTITTDDLICNDYKISNLSLGGVVPLVVNSNIPASNQKFVYDPKVGEDQKGHYKLLILSNGITPVAQFGGGNVMEGMRPNDRFSIYVISMLSSGEQMFSFGDSHPAIPIYSVANFRPLTISTKENYFNMLGTVDFNIPRTEKNYQCNLIYKVGAQKATVSMMPVGLVINGPGGVVYSAGSNQTLNASGYSADGTIEENGLFKLNANLYRPFDFNSIKIKVDSNSNQILNISTSSKLQKVYGNMAIKSNDWNYFTFGGTMIGAKGIGTTKPQKLNFTVYGDIKADNQSIGVQNVSLPGGFGGISLIYDFKNSRLTGEMEFDAPFNGVGVKGAANVVFDNLGWYFLAGGSAQIPGIGGTNAGILIGDYPKFTSGMQNTLMQFCYNKNVPCDYISSGVHGFFLSGTKSVPIVNIPDIHLDILVASMALGFDCGVDARMYMNFTDQSTKVGVGAMAYAHAYFVLESSFCTTMSAEATQELLIGGTYDFATKSFDFQGCGSISIKGSIEQCIGALGVCGGCVSASVEQSLKIELSLGSSNGIHGLSVGIGNCSTPSPKPCK